MEADLGHLRLKIGGDVRDLDAAEKRAKKSMESIDRTASLVSSSVVRAMQFAGATVSVGLVANALHAAAMRMAEVSNNAQAIGQSSKEFSRLEYAATSSGVSVQDLTASVRLLAKNLTVNDPMSEASRALQALGLAYHNTASASHDTGRSIERIADKFASFNDGARKTALAMALFGDSGTKLIPFLNKGAAGIKELKEEADRLGITLSSDTSKDAKEYEANMNRMKGVVSAVANAITAELLPGVNSASAAFVNWSKDVDLANSAASRTRDMLNWLNDAWVIMKGSIAGAVAAISNWWEALTLAAQGQFTAAREALAKTGELALATAESYASQLTQNKAVIQSLRGTTDELEKQAKAREKRDAPAIVSAAELLRLEQERKALYTSMQTDIVGDNTKTTTDKIAALDAMVKAGQISWRDYVSTVKSLNDAETQAAMSALMDNQRLPMAAKLEELNRLWADGRIGIHAYAAAHKQATDEGQRGMDDLLSTTSQALTSIFQKNKAAAIASAVINTYQGITKALAQYPPPISFAMAGLQAAMGFAQVANIRSQTASGGGGGGAAVPSATSVPATPSAGSGGGSSGQGQGQTLYVQGINPSDLFTGETMRTLARKLLQHQRDGGHVILGAA